MICYCERLSSSNLVKTCGFGLIIIRYLLIMLMLSSIVVTGLSTFSIDEPKNDLTLCVVQSPRSDENIKLYCPNMHEGHIKCEVVLDRSECLRKLIFGEADFTVLEPEDLLVAQKFSEGNIFATHELRLLPTHTASTEMVALVNGNINQIADMKGKNFCHPGFDVKENWTPVFANYLQEQLIPNKCSPELSLLENKFATLSEYFRSACIAGPWTTDVTLDKQLKSKYSNLCELCESGCHSGDMYHGPVGAVLCLTDNLGDIAFVKLDDALNHFQTLKINTTLYRYLCSDGSLREVDGGVPCSFIQRPWPVVATRKETADEIKRVIDSIKNWRCKWQTELLDIMELYVATPYGLGGKKNIEAYLDNFQAFAYADAYKSCVPSVKWCVSSNLEARKCQWLKESAFARGIGPGIACHQHQNREMAMKALSNEDCEIFVANPEEIQPHSGLTSVLEILPKDDKNLYEFKKIGIIVMKNSKLQKLEDLRGQRVCVTGIGSIGWNSFYGVMKNRTNDPLWNCPASMAMPEFFEKIISPENEDGKTDVVASTYDCLTSGKGDVAIVDLRDSYFLDRNYLKTICVDGSNDPQCYLSWTTLGSVIAKDNMTLVRREEIIQLFEELDTWFGTHYVGLSPAISLYGSFDSANNIIFPAKAESLQRVTRHEKFPRNYQEIMNQLATSDNYSYFCSSAITNFVNAIVFMTTIILLRFI